jgi:hypothetical protein
MYRLMKSEMRTSGQVVSKYISPYLQIQIGKFPKISDAVTACGVANTQAGSRHYILNELGREYYEGTWID